MSFWKHEPPKPTEALRNLEPRRESMPTAWATSSMLAPVASQMAERALTDEMRWASIALAASFESSDDHRPTVRICDFLSSRMDQGDRASLACQLANDQRASGPAGTHGIQLA